MIWEDIAWGAAFGVFTVSIYWSLDKLLGPPASEASWYLRTAWVVGVGYVLGVRFGRRERART